MTQARKTRIVSPYLHDVPQVCGDQLLEGLAVQVLLPSGTLQKRGHQFLNGVLHVGRVGALSLFLKHKQEKEGTQMMPG